MFGGLLYYVYPSACFVFQMGAQGTRCGTISFTALPSPPVLSGFVPRLLSLTGLQVP